MATKFLNILSSDLTKFLETGEYSDVIIRVENDIETILEVMKAAGEFGLTDILEYLEDQLLLKNHMEELLITNFAMIYQFVQEYDEFSRLKEFCELTIKNDPLVIFEGARDFVKINQDLLITLLKSKYLFVNEICLWEKLVEWGLNQFYHHRRHCDQSSLISSSMDSLSSSMTVSSTLSPPPLSPEWKTKDFRMFGEIIKPCVLLINFAFINPKDFKNKVEPFRKAFDEELYDKILEIHLSQQDTAISTLFQNLNNADFNSNLITLKHLALISGWIINDNNPNDIKPHNIPFEFKLLVRGSRDGLGPKIFHEKCDLKGPTVTILRVHNSGEILGGYNPLNWETDDNGKFNQTKKSFIFSLGHNELNNTIFSKVVETQSAILQYNKYGPCFGSDLILTEYYNEYERNWEGRCIKGKYENKISPNYIFFANEYEVFQVIRKKN
ncbi:8423_t:CDS:2 [Entrophospora sp. SA101]|nr:8423_t:CDS:2 [Entrophospora sp. SA101]